MQRLTPKSGFLVLAAGLLFTALPACKKNDDTPVNHAEITIDSPREGKDYIGPVVIQATLVGDQDLHGWEMNIRPVGGGAALFQADFHDHGKTLTINETWTPAVTVQTEVELEIIAILDHDDSHRDSKKVKFIVKP